MARRLNRACHISEPHQRIGRLLLGQPCLKTSSKPDDPYPRMRCSAQPVLRQYTSRRSFSTLSKSLRVSEKTLSSSCSSSTLKTCAASCSSLRREGPLSTKIATTNEPPTGLANGHTDID